MPRIRKGSPQASRRSKKGWATRKRGKKSTPDPTNTPFGSRAKVKPQFNEVKPNAPVKMNAKRAAYVAAGTTMLVNKSSRPGLASYKGRRSVAVPARPFVVGAGAAMGAKAYNRRAAKKHANKPRSS